MADFSIVANIDEFDRAINSIVMVVQEFESIQSNIQQVNSELKGSWKGKTSKEFFESSDAILEKFAEYKEGLTVLCQDLGAVRDSFVTVDSELSVLIREGSTE